MSETDKEVDALSGVETTGHSWDGIKELNNPLPRWWLYIWYGTIFWAILDRDAVAESVASLHAERSAASAQLLDASLQDIQNNLDLQQFAMAMGESAFGDNCATCHGSGGRGAKGYPMLADDVWLWDGTLDGIEQTIRHGIRHEEDPDTRFSAMPAFGRDGLLTSAQIDDLVQYVLSVSGHEANAAAVARGDELFLTNCASCHGMDAEGSRDVGAPNLTDADWLYGSNPEDIRATITNARNSHMPARHWLFTCTPSVAVSKTSNRSILVPR